MNAVGQYLLRKPINAAWVIVACTFIPLMGWLASVILGLVTLCKSPKESTIALTTLVLANLAHAYWLMQRGDPLALACLSFIGSAVVGGLFLWIMALLLHHYRNWVSVLMFTILLGLPLLLVANIHMTELGGFLTQWFEDTLESILQLGGGILPIATQNDITQLSLQFYQRFFIPELASYFAGCIIIMFLYTAGIAQLIIARWWQAHMDTNATSIREELLQIRMPCLLSIIFVILITVLLILKTPMLFGVLPIIITAWLIAGLSVIHALAHQHKTGWLWLLLIYIGLFAVNKIVLPMLLLAACLDSVFNLRQRFCKSLSN